MEIDIQYFISKLSGIDGFGKVGENLAAKVESKKVEPEKKEEEERPKPDAGDAAAVAEEKETKPAAAAEGSTEAPGTGEDEKPNKVET